MIIMMNENRMKSVAKRLRKVLRELGLELKHTDCLAVAVALCGFENWREYLDRDLDEPLGLLDDELSEAEFGARDAFQMAVLDAAGFGAVARELLDRANPTGAWRRDTTEQPSSDTIAGNDPL
jgi:hypothetical protein